MLLAQPGGFNEKRTTNPSAHRDTQAVRRVNDKKLDVSFMKEEKNPDVCLDNKMQRLIN